MNKDERKKRRGRGKLKSHPWTRESNANERKERRTRRRKYGRNIPEIGRRK
jgi:hypothetical protein